MIGIDNRIPISDDDESTSTGRKRLQRSGGLNERNMDVPTTNHQQAEKDRTDYFKVRNSNKQINN